MPVQGAMPGSRNDADTLDLDNHQREATSVYLDLHGTTCLHRWSVRVSMFSNWRILRYKKGICLSLKKSNHDVIAVNDVQMGSKEPSKNRIFLLPLKKIRLASKRDQFFRIFKKIWRICRFILYYTVKTADLVQRLAVIPKGIVPKNSKTKKNWKYVKSVQVNL